MKNRPRRLLLYALLRGVMFLVGMIPRRAALALGRTVGRAAFFLVARQRKRVLGHLRLAFGEEKKPREIFSIARKVFENLAMTAVDVILFPKLNRENLRDWISYDDEFMRVNRILNEGKGVIIMTGHIGNWELLAAVFGVMGYYGAVVGRKIYYEKYNRLLVRLREGARVRTIYRDSSAKEMLRVLKSNQILGMLADQDVDSVEGIFVDFFGRPAYTPTAPVKLALAAETAIVPGFVIREGGRYRLILEEPIYPSDARGAREDLTREFTERWASVVERFIRKYPEQWVWMHDRWKTKYQLDSDRQDAIREGKEGKVEIHG